MSKRKAAAFERVRAICLALPGAEERVSWHTPVFCTGGRQFAIFLDDHHGDGRLALWCKADDGVQETLVKADPKNFFVPPYVGPRGWIGVRLDRGLGWKAVEALIADSWLLLAPKKLAAAFLAAHGVGATLRGRFRIDVIRRSR